MSSVQWCFDRFRLDLGHACLWCGPEVVNLPPKAFGVLHYLVTHPDRLVTKDELLDAVWPDTAVTDAVVRVAIGALRKALDDTAHTPRYIATMARRGYRFLAPVTLGPPAAATPAPTVRPQPAPTLPLLVERDTVLAQLHTHLAAAQQGRRQVVLVTGEPGIGKTAVVDTFLGQLAPHTPLRLASGQCVEQYGPGEAYRPILEALGQLCRGVGGAPVVALLRHQAPTWLVQLPWLLSEADRAQLHAELHGTSRERMLREGAEVIDSLTAVTPLVLVLEDLHWSDTATVELLGVLARRQTPARLLVLATYRPVEALVHHPPLRTVMQDLQRRGVVTDIPLASLSVAAVDAYLTARFPQPHFPAALAPWLQQRTDGNPLFLVTLVQALVTQGIVRAHNGGWTVQREIEALTLDVPASLGQLLLQQIRRLPLETQGVLEVASVAGVEFAAPTVAAGLEGDVEAVEEHCEALVTHQLLRPLGVSPWPNGLVVTRYAFRHGLYQQGIYEQVGVGRRMRLHQRLGAYLEGAYGPQAGEIAAELAEHFGRGQDTRRAVHYLHRAAENATQRYAHREVVALLTRALALLGQMPETLESAQQELALQLILGGAWMALKGFAAPEAGHAFSRARVLCQQVEDTSQRFPALYGVWLFALIDGALWTAQELAEQLLHLAQQSPDTPYLLVASWASSTTCWHRGEFLQALTHARHGVALYDPQQHHELAARYVFDPGVTCLAVGAIALWYLGAPEQALARLHDALGLAQKLAYPLSLAFALASAMAIHQHRGEPQATGEQAAALVALCTAHGPAQYLAMGKFLQGWVLAAQGACEEALGQMRQSVAAFRATGAAAAWQPYFLTTLAEVSAQAGQPKEGLHLLAEAQTVLETTGERWWEAEVHRLRGELLWRHAMPEAAQAETCFQHALAVARRQQAKSLELRAATSLARLWQQQGKRAEAHQLLAEVYGWFTEGFDTVDLREARALLETL